MALYKDAFLSESMHILRLFIYFSFIFALKLSIKHDLFMNSYADFTQIHVYVWLVKETHCPKSATLAQPVVFVWET